MCQNIGNFLTLVKTANFQWFLAFFSAHIDPIELKSGILRQKFRVPTRHTLEHFEISIFFTLTPPPNKTLTENIFNKKGGMIHPIT